MSGPLTGVRTRIMEDNPQPIYMHCHAHQLNLALVDCCTSLSHASNFFSLLESLYVYMSSSLNYQKELKMKEVKLIKLSDTRWSCRHTSIKAVKTTFTAICASLQELCTHTGNRAIEARGLYHQIISFSFLLSLFLTSSSLSLENSVIYYSQNSLTMLQLLVV